MIDPRAIEGAKPHRRIAYLVTVDGRDLGSILRKRLISLTHTDNRGFEPDTVDIELDDSDGSLDLPPRGAVIRLSFGWANEGMVPKGSYTVAEVAHAGTPDVLSIRATSADISAGLTTQRERSWDNVTLSAIVATIADENGLKPQIHPTFYNTVIDHIDQTNESAANFLSRLAIHFDAIATVKEGRLLFTPAASGQTASGKPIPGIVIERLDGDRHQFQISDRNTYQGVRATYNDADAATKGEVIWGDNEDGAERGKQPKPTPPPPPVGQYKPLKGTYPTRNKALKAAEQEWKRIKASKPQRAAFIGVKAAYNDRNLKSKGEVTYGLADDEKKITNAQKLAEKDAEKLDPKPTSNNAFERSAENVKTLRHVYSSKANALRAARAEWRRLQRGMATFNITLAIGDPAIFPETPATVRGFKPQIDSTDWLVTKVTNTLSGDGGYSQRLEFEIKATEIPD